MPTGTTDTDLDNTRRDLVTASHQLDRLGLAPGSSGNVSVRNGSTILITPTGGSLGTLGTDDLAELDLTGAWRAGAAPSKEVPLHTAFYRRDPTIGAAVHLHSEHATAVACRRPWSQHSALPPITPYFLMRVGQTPLLPFAPPGSNKLARHLDSLDVDVRSVLLANHGSLVAADDLAGAVDAAIELEAASRTHLLSEGTGQSPLSGQQINELREHHRILWSD